MPAMFIFEIHTPYRLFFSGQAEAITLTLSDGEITVYARHSSFTAVVTSCILRIKNDQGIWKSAFISDGILEVKEHKNVLVVGTAEWPEEIDSERALAAKQHAEEKIKSAAGKYEISSARTRLRRAEFRLKACSL